MKILHFWFSYSEFVSIPTTEKSANCFFSNELINHINVNTEGKITEQFKQIIENCSDKRYRLIQKISLQ
jgi:hypothetical protein